MAGRADAQIAMLPNFMGRESIVLGLQMLEPQSAVRRIDVDQSGGRRVMDNTTPDRASC
ncbi:MAG: hypothetical protein K2Z80_34590 [Xanthobacteraceae bacterium]|nr:hypothetical protein [Xanthobacteraceae bacterium]